MKFMLKTKYYFILNDRLRVSFVATKNECYELFNYCWWTPQQNQLWRLVSYCKIYHEGQIWKYIEEDLITTMEERRTVWKGEN